MTIPNTCFYITGICQTSEVIEMFLEKGILPMQYTKSMCTMRLAYWLWYMAMVKSKPTQ